MTTPWTAGDMMTLVEVRIDTGCWDWVGSIDHGGYGRRFYQDKATRKTVNASAHRTMFELWKHKIPEGLTLDHLCRNRACVNPFHLEPVSMRTNLLRGDGWTSKNARKTECKRGHLFDAANTYIDSDGCRACRACARMHDARRRGRTP